MHFSEYQDKAVSTAIYPGKNSLAGLQYVILGLNGEAGEVAEQVKKALRDDNGYITEERLLSIKKELGDVLWYIANAAHELSILLDSIAEENINKIQSRKTNNTVHGSGSDR